MNSQLIEPINLLGFRCKDKVTGFSGVLCSVSFDLYGCVQGWINPGLDKDGKMAEGGWFDMTRITITSKKRVMDHPHMAITSTISGKGPEMKAGAGH